MKKKPTTKKKKRNVLRTKALQRARIEAYKKIFSTIIEDKTVNDPVKKKIAKLVQQHKKRESPPQKPFRLQRVPLNRERSKLRNTLHERESYTPWCLTCSHDQLEHDDKGCTSIECTCKRTFRSGYLVDTTPQDPRV